MARIHTLLLAGFLLSACAPKPESQAPAAASAPAAEAPVAQPAPDRLELILAGSHRDPANVARDIWRHPRETLSFFGLTDSMTVVEIWPGNGWYTEIIAPYVRENGKYYAAGLDPASEQEFMRKGVEAFKAKLDANPQLYDRVAVTVLVPPEKTEIAPPGSADMVLTFRNIHNWMGFGTEDAAFKAMYDALKPGGVLGIVDHRGNPAVEQDPKAKSGYVNEDYAIALAEKAGFVLEEKSEINANPADTKDYAEGVWALPPRLINAEKDADKYQAIGESDRFTLRFRKPAA